MRSVMIWILTAPTVVASGQEPLRLNATSAALDSVILVESNEFTLARVEELAATFFKRHPNKQLARLWIVTEREALNIPMQDPHWDLVDFESNFVRLAARHWRVAMIVESKRGRTVFYRDGEQIVRNERTGENEGLVWHVFNTRWEMLHIEFPDKRWSAAVQFPNVFVYFRASGETVSKEKVAAFLGLLTRDWYPKIFQLAVGPSACFYGEPLFPVFPPFQRIGDPPRECRNVHTCLAGRGSSDNANCWQATLKFSR